MRHPGSFPCGPVIGTSVVSYNPCTLYPGPPDTYGEGGGRGVKVIRRNSDKKMIPDKE